MSQIQYPNVSLNLTQDKLEVKVNGTEFVREIPVNIVEINGKLYYQPKWRDIILDASDVSVDTTVKPVVRYVKFQSGVVAPLDLVTSVMDELKKLDEEYMQVKEKFEKVCKGDVKLCSSFKEYEELYLKQFALIGKQAKIIVQKLKEAGFVIRAKKQDVGYVVYISYDNEVNGRWEPLSSTVEAYIRFGGGKYDKDVLVQEIDEDLRLWYIRIPESPVKSWYAEVVTTDDGNVYFDYNGLKIFPVKKIGGDEVIKDHKYIVHYVEITEDIAIALSFSPSHEMKTERKVNTAVIEKKGKKYLIDYGWKAEVCEKCGIKISERPLIKNEGRTFLFEVDGKLYAVRSTEEGDELTLVSEVVGDLKPDARYKTVPVDGVYVPLDYLTPEEIKSLEGLAETLRKKHYDYMSILKAVAKKLAGYLKRRGFKIESYEDDEVTWCRVKAPDGKEGKYEVYEDWDYDMTWTTDSLEGELSLLAESLYPLFF